MVVVTVGGESYFMDPRLRDKWDSIKDGKLKKIDEDRVYIVDGRERAGKSVFALQQAAYIDPTIIKDLSRITFSAEETLEAIRNTKSTKTQTKAIIFDEAFRGLSSKSALSKTNKKIVQSLMEMGQNNTVLFLVSPSVFLLEMYSAVLRSNTLFHILKRKSGRRSFRAFNYQKKAMLYQIGIKKGWGYKVNTRIVNNFSNKYPGGAEFEKEYRKKKAKSIRAMDTEEKDYVNAEVHRRVMENFRASVKGYRIDVGKAEKGKMLSEKVASDRLKEHGCEISATHVGKITRETLLKHPKTTNTPSHYI